MKHQFTKGKWQISRHSKFYIQTDSGRGIASTGGYQENNNSEAIEIENIANAKLIAAAPELLENLIRLLDRVEENGHGGNFPSAIRRAKEAIKKATEL